MKEFFTKQRLKKTKFFLTLNLLESIKLLENIDNSNADIEDNKIIYTASDFPLIEKKNKLMFTEQAKKEFTNFVLSSNNADGTEPILSLLNVIDQNKKETYSVLSVQILSDFTIGEFYINYNFLSKVFFNEYQKNRLIQQEEVLDIHGALNTLKKGFINSLSNSNNELEDFENSNIENKIIKLINILNTNYGNKYTIIKNYIVYQSGDLDLNRYTKTDYQKILSKIKEEDNNNLFNFVQFYNKTELYQNNLFELKDQELEKNLTLSQKISINGATKNNFSIINGIPGSGKTEISIKMIIKNLHLNAIAKANLNKNLNFLFTTYNKKALYDFKTRFNEYGLEELLYVNDELDSNFHSVLEKINYSLNIELTSKEKTRYLNLEKKLKQQYPNTVNIIKLHFLIKDLKKELMNNVNFINKLIPLEKLKRKLSVLDEISLIDKILYRIGIDNTDKILITKDISEQFIEELGLKNEKNIIDIVIGQKILDKLPNLEIEIRKENKIFLQKISETLKNIEDKIKKMANLEKDNNNISLEDTIFYLKNYYRFNQKKEHTKKLIDYLKQDIFSNKKEKDILFKVLGGEDEILKGMFDIFPIHLSIISKLGRTYPLKEIFDFTVVDESYQTPGYFIFSLIPRTNFLIGVGDNGQIENNNLYNNVASQNIYEEIYDKKSNILKRVSIDNKFKDIDEMEIYEFYNNYGSSKITNNLFNLIKNDERIINILIDNFRSNKEIVMATLFTSFKYQNIIRTFLSKTQNIIEDEIYKEKVQKELLNWNEDSIYQLVEAKIDRVDTFKSLSNKPIKGNLFYLNTSFVNESDNEYLFQYYKEILDFIELQQYKYNNTLTGKDILFITPFKSDALDLTNFLIQHKNLYPEIINGILCESVENIQGVERKIVVFISGIYGEHSQEINYITEKPEVMTVAISRAKDLFLFVGNITYILDSNQQNILNKLFNQNKYFRLKNIK